MLLNKTTLGSAEAPIYLYTAEVKFPVLNQICMSLIENRAESAPWFDGVFSAVKPQSVSGSWREFAKVAAVLSSYTDRVFLYKPAFVPSGSGFLSAAM